MAAPTLPQPGFQIVTGATLRGKVFNGTKCSVCGRKVFSEPFVTLGIGPVCYMRKYRCAAIGSLATSLLKDAVDPVTQLANIGFNQNDIEKADMNGFLLAMSELSLVYRNVELSSRIADNFQGQAAGIGETSKSTFSAMNIAAKGYINDVQSGKETDPKKQLMTKATVLCSGVGLIRHVASTLTALGDEHINHFESIDLRQSIQSALISSRLYAHVAKGERKMLSVDDAQQSFDSFFDEDLAPEVPAENNSAYHRAGVNFGGKESEIIDGMSEKNPEARAVLEALVNHAGGMDEAVVIISLMDDMNIRGKQIAVAYEAAAGNNEVNAAGIERLVEAAWQPEDLSAAVNARATAAGIAHKAVPMGAQMGDRKLLPGYSHSDPLPAEVTSVRRQQEAPALAI